MLASRFCSYSPTVTPSTPALAARRCRSNALVRASSSTWCSSAVKRIWRELRATSFTRASLAGRDTRPCVRSPAVPPRFPSGRGLPSGRLVSFAAVISTTPRSATPSQLSLATPVVPCRRPPPVTKPEAPIGLPRFRRVPFMHEMAFDPGRAATPRIRVPFA